MTTGFVHPALLRLHSPAEPLPARLTRVVGRGAVTALGVLPGAILGTAAGVAGTLRHGKPLHPQGKVGEATLDITVPRPDLGIPIFQRQGERPCTVRWSRSVGLPDSWPDFEGMAVRFHDPVSDVLFASTGTGVVGRHVLVPRPGHTHGPLTTLLPVSTTAGPLLLALTPVDDADPPTLFHVSVALEGEEWDRVGLLRVAWGEDREMHFDPVTNQLPGTEQYAVVRAVREPAYLFARLATPR